jgi:hypothetical protein
VGGRGCDEEEGMGGRGSGMEEGGRRREEADGIWKLANGRGQCFFLSEPRVKFALALRVRVPEAASRPPVEVGMKEVDLGRHCVDAVPTSLTCSFAV